MLSSFDEKIELLREQNKTLETLAQTIFKEWFVNFNYPDATGEMVDSELGEIPKGWRVGKLGDEFDIVMGQSPKGSSYNESGDGMVFYQGRAEFQSRFPQRRLYTTEPKRLAEKYDVLMSVRAPVGDINVASEKCCIGRGLAAIHSEKKAYALYKMMSLSSHFDLFESEGTVFGSINKKSLECIEVVIPSTEVINTFETVAWEVDKKVFNNTSQIQELSKLRDTLLPKLMSGQLRSGG
jgi:type I restriction enzyme S subunit